MHHCAIIDLELRVPFCSRSCTSLIYFALTTLNTLISTYILLPRLVTGSALIANSCMGQNRSWQRSAPNQLMCASCTTLATEFDNELAQSQKGAGSVLCEALVNT